MKKNVLVPDVFYVLGNGDVFTYGDFLSYSPPGNEVKGYFRPQGQLCY